MKKFLSKIRSSREFNPGILGLFFNPFFIARRGLYTPIESFSKKLTGKLLDVGCGNKPYLELFKHTDYVGLEYDTEISRAKQNADFYYTGTTFPFKDNTFDSLISNQVLEHVFSPDAFLQECHRVIKPGGCFVLSVPFVWDEHEQPYDFARYSSFGIKDLLKRNGWSIEESVKTCIGLQTVLQMANCFIVKVIPTKNRKIHFVLSSVFAIPFNILAIIMELIPLNNADLYLDNIILAKKV